MTLSYEEANDLMLLAIARSQLRLERAQVRLDELKNLRDEYKDDAT